MKLTKKNYFSKEASLHYMSNSQYKDFISCEERALAQMNGEWDAYSCEGMEVGSYVHAWNEDDLDNFKKDNPHIFRISDGELKANFRMGDDIIEMIKRSKMFMNVLSGKKEVFLTAEMFGTPWKIMIDSYCPDKKRFGDLKVLKGLHDRFWDKNERCYKNVFEYRGYLVQMAIYAEIERLANGRKEGDYFEPFLALVEKDKHNQDKEIVSFVSEEESVSQFVARQLEMVEYNMPRVLAVKRGQESPTRCNCNDCGYCRATKVLTSTTHYSAFAV